MWRSEPGGARSAHGYTVVPGGVPRAGARTDGARTDPRLVYLPGLDGLRALAVIAVVLYHAGLPLRGGYLGVECFFVLSGFLITALLRAEWNAQGRIDLAAFWLRRARRLLPALVVVLLGTLALHAVLLPDGLAALGEDIVAALAYVMNWRLVWSQQSYFDPLVRPPLLQHLWSLAIEEQFYLVWPVLFVGGMRFVRASGLLVLTVTAAMASAVWMAMLYQPGADPSRIYYGTDTRAAGLLLGATLALWWTPGRAVGGRSGRVFDIFGLLALAGLAAAVVGLPETHPLLYRGGFVLVALGTTSVIVAVAEPSAVLVPRLLAWRPLIWIGRRSYGIYLWHWPVFLVTRPQMDVPLAGWPLLLLRLLLVVGLAALSYRFVEEPIRHGGIERTWRSIGALRAARWRPTSRSVRGRNRLALAIVSVIVASIGTFVPAPSPASRPARSAAAPPSPAAALTSPAAALTSPAVALTSPAAVPSGGPEELEVAALRGAPAPPPATATATPRPGPSPVAATAAVVPTATAPAAAASEPAPTPAGLPSIDDALAADLQRLLDKTVADSSIPGAVLAVGIPGYAPWLGASGVADTALGAPMEPSTQIRIASTSKLFTAVVVLQLVEEGRVELDAPIAAYLPELLPAGDAITVRQLLNHTSGLYDYLEDRDLVAEAYREPERGWTPSALVAYAARFPLSFRPGAAGAWNYSSTNYVVLGMLVEQRTGNPLAAEIRRRILEPLDLAHTVFTPDESIPGTLAHGYADNVDLTDAPMTIAFGTASIVSTAGDLQRFATALFNGELLRPETLAKMAQLVDGHGQYGMPDLEYGLGVMRNRLPVGPAPDGTARPAAASTVLGHIGGFAGFRSAVWYSQENGVTIAVGINQAAADPNALATSVLDAILATQGR